MAVDEAPRKREASPAHYPEAGPAPKKKAKAQADDDGEGGPPEKRQFQFKKKCPKALQERYERVVTQRFSCVERNRTSETSEDFKVLGSTGNVYSVKITSVPSCTCPDGKKNGQCKHIMFALVKILRVPQTSNLWYQKALLQVELESVFANAPRDRTDAKERRLRDAYAVAVGKKAAPLPSEEAGVPKRLPGKDDSCPVCYEDFTEGQTKDLAFCIGINGCGNGLHTECHAQWAAQTKPVTCVFCRSPWTGPIAAVPVAGPSYSSEGYLNMAAQAGKSTFRDTSSYYHGPQRGKKWDGGYGRYGGY